MNESHYAWLKDAHLTAADYLAEASNSMYDGLQTSIKGLLDGTMSISDAWKNLGDTMAGALIQMAAQAIASNLMVAIMGKPIAAATAASMVSLATMGANAAPASAGISTTTALAQGLAQAGGLASGGPVKGSGTGTSDSIPALLSNGEYVLKAAAAKKIGEPMLNMLNRGGRRRALLPAAWLPAPRFPPWASAALPWRADCRRGAKAAALWSKAARKTIYI
jgi:hypothetical protein